MDALVPLSFILNNIPTDKLKTQTLEMPGYTCYCSLCVCKTYKTLKTVREHLQRDENALALAGPLQPGQRNHPLQKHIDDTERSILQAAVAESRVSSAHVSSSSAGPSRGQENRPSTPISEGTSKSQPTALAVDLIKINFSRCGCDRQPHGH